MGFSTVYFEPSFANPPAVFQQCVYQGVSPQNGVGFVKSVTTTSAMVSNIDKEPAYWFAIGEKSN